MRTLAQHPGIKREEKKNLDKFLKQECTSLEKTATFVKLARCSKTFDEEKFRVQLNSTSESQMALDLLIKYLKEDGGKIRTSAAPKGPRERRIEQYLRGAKKEEDEEEEEE